MGLAPCGASGLKFYDLQDGDHLYKSRPVRGEWIEISCTDVESIRNGKSRPVRGEWIEIQ